MNRLIVKLHELLGAKRNAGVCFTAVIAKLNFVLSRSPIFHDRTNLAANEFSFRQILSDRHNRLHLNIRSHAPSISWYPQVAKRDTMGRPHAVSHPRETSPARPSLIG